MPQQNSIIHAAIRHEKEEIKIYKNPQIFSHGGFH
jgi:hypothetical protein